MAAYQLECSRIQQRSIIEFLLAEKCKPHEIYWKKKKKKRKRKREAAKRMFTNGLRISLQLWIWIKRTAYGVEAHCVSGKDKILQWRKSSWQSSGTQKDPPLLISLKKLRFLLPTPLAKFTLFIKWLSYIYIYIYIYVDVSVNFFTELKNGFMAVIIWAV